MAGMGTNVAIQIKEMTLNYFEDRFADWIVGQGGWVSRTAVWMQLRKHSVELVIVSFIMFLLWCIAVTIDFDRYSPVLKTETEEYVKGGIKLVFGLFSKLIAIEHQVIKISC